MALKCILGFHSWNGCKCSDCGKTRDELHDWTDCKCSKCEKEQHDWSQDCEKCSICGKTRKYAHDWSQDCEKCSICGNKPSNDWQSHRWYDNCQKCSECGKEREIEHNWNGCICTKCRHNRHSISEPNSCYCEKCSSIVHVIKINSNICVNCGRFIFEDIEQYFNYKSQIYDIDVLANALLDMGVFSRAKLLEEANISNSLLNKLLKQDEFIEKRQRYMTAETANRKKNLALLSEFTKKNTITVK